MKLSLPTGIALLAVLLTVGCGGGSENSGDQAIATNAVMISSDFDADVRKRASVVSEAPCNPRPFLQGAQMTESATFIVDGTSVQQVIGVFPTVAGARDAFKALGSASRRACIASTLRLYSSQQAEANSISKTLPPRSSNIGDEAQFLPFEVDQPRSPVGLRVNVVLSRVDRAVTDLLFLTESAQMPTALIRGTSERAATRLTEALN